MKKYICAALSIVMIFTLAACGSSGSNDSGSVTESSESVTESVESAAESSVTAQTESGVQDGQASGKWTREGYYDNENGDFLSVSFSDLEGYEGWYVGCMIGEDSYGNVIREEDGKLHGNLIPDYEEGEFIVTVSEEGEDGLLLEVEDGDSYHFTVMDTSGYEAAITVTINTEGDGYVGYVENDEESAAGMDFRYTSTQLNFDEAKSITIGARALEGWEFEKWTRNGEDYSAEPQITIECTESADYVAVFEPCDQSAET